MQNQKPLPFESDCPKCGARLRGEMAFCDRVQSCKTWTRFGGQHLHISCPLCRYIRTTVCKDQDSPLMGFEELNAQLEVYAEESAFLDDVNSQLNMAVEDDDLFILESDLIPKAELLEDLEADFE